MLATKGLGVSGMQCFEQVLNAFEHLLNEIEPNLDVLTSFISSEDISLALKNIY